MLSSLTWEKLARKNIKKKKRFEFRLTALFLLKNIFCLYFSPIVKLWQRKKSHFQSFRFLKVLQDLNAFLDPQCIISQLDFQHKILNWSTLFPLLSLHASKGREEWAGTTKIVCKFRSRHLEMLNEKHLFWKFRGFFTKTAVFGSCFKKNARPVTVLK